MLMAQTRTASRLAAIAFGFALALLAPWHAAGAATGASYIAPSGTTEHRAGCPLLVELAQPVLAPAAKTPTHEPGNAADCPRHAWSDLAPDSPARAGLVPVAPPVSSRPLYLLTLRLRR